MNRECVIMAVGMLAATAAGAPQELPSDGIEAWRMAHGAERCALIVPLAARLNPAEAAELILLSQAETRTDWVQRYVLGSSILARTEDNRWWKERAGDDSGDDGRSEWTALCVKGRAAAVLLSKAPDWQTRLLAADLLRVFGPDESTSCLDDLLGDALWPVRLRAVEALGSSPAESSRSRLMQYVRSQDRTERLAAIEACERMPLVAGVLAGLSDSDAEVQVQSIAAAGRLLGEDAPVRDRAALVSALERLSRTPGDEAVRRKAQEALRAPAEQGDIVK